MASSPGSKPARVAPSAVRVYCNVSATFTKRYLSGENYFQIFIIATLHRKYVVSTIYGCVHIFSNPLNWKSD